MRGQTISHTLSRSLLARSALLSIILIGILTGWYYWYYQSLTAQEKQLQIELAQLVERRTLFYAVQQELAFVQDACDNLSHDITTIACKKKSGTIQELFKNIVFDADNCDVLLTHCSPCALQMKTWYKKQALQFRAAGTYFDFRNLLKNISNYDFFMKIPQMHIKRHNDILLLDCIVQTYQIE